MKWSEQENINQTKVTLHCYQESEVGPFYSRYTGNKSLCGKWSVGNGDKIIKVNEIEPSELNKEQACKTCLKIFNKGE